jgi:hypothetical protein
MNERELEYEKLWEELSQLDDKHWEKETLAFSLEEDSVNTLKELLWYMENKSEYEKCARILKWLNSLSEMIVIGETLKPEGWEIGGTGEQAFYNQFS